MGLWTTQGVAHRAHSPSGSSRPEHRENCVRHVIGQNCQSCSRLHITRPPGRRVRITSRRFCPTPLGLRARALQPTNLREAVPRQGQVRVRPPATIQPEPVSGLSPVLGVADLLQPLDRVAVERLLNREVSHRHGRRGAVPVLLLRREPHRVAGAELADRSAPSWARPKPERTAASGRGDGCAKPSARPARR